MPALRAILAAALLLGGPSAAAGPTQAATLEVGPPAGGEPYVRRAVKVGDTVTYRFVHSVSRTPVEEAWAVVEEAGRPALRLRSVSYQSTGAGLPSGPEVPGATFEASAKGFLVRGLDRLVGLPLDLRVSPEAENALRIGDETIDLTRFPAPSGGGPASLVRLTLR